MADFNDDQLLTNYAARRLISRNDRALVLDAFPYPTAASSSFDQMECDTKSLTEVVPASMEGTARVTG